IISLSNPSSSDITTPLSEAKKVLTDTKSNMETFNGWTQGTEFSELLSSQKDILESLSGFVEVSYTDKEASAFYSDASFAEGVQTIAQEIASASTPVTLLDIVAKSLNSIAETSGSWWQNFVNKYAGHQLMADGKIWVDDNGQLHADGSAEAAAFLANLSTQGDFEIGGVKFNGEGKAYVGAKAAAEIKANLTENGLDVTAKAEALLGVKASASGGFTVGEGLLSLAGDAKVEAIAGAWGVADAKLKIDKYGIQATAQAEGKAGAEATGKAGVNALGNRVGASVEGDAFAGAKAKANASFEANTAEGVVKGSAGVSAFAGAEANVKGNVKAAYTTATVGTGVKAGVGFEAKTDFQVGDGHLKVDLDLGAALGIGADVDVSLDFNYKEAIDDAGKVLSMINPFD
ncbi:hypothetical protein AB3331_11155, partial [Streptococcus sp. H49]|uniref:hypothetical protein n=1 Tax=Streptococcus huangxiaojuni TaxID=3237239 RepID=UPI0034A1A751